MIEKPLNNISGVNYIIDRLITFFRENPFKEVLSVNENAKGSIRLL